MTTATLLSVNVGLPKDVPWQGRTVHTGIWKRPVDRPQMVRRLNIDGDGQGDLNGHGGEQRAVLVYQLDSYRYWQRHFGGDGFEFGQFGENFTVDGLPDDEVCVGDRYRIGAAEFEVTQPRVTCFRVGMRMGQPELPSLSVAHHRPGFYLRVITEGYVQAGDEIVCTGRGRHAVSVAEMDALLYLPARTVDMLRAAVDIPALSPGWQQSFRELLIAAELGTGGDTLRVGAEPGWVGFRRLRVIDLVAETPAVTSVYLAAADGASLPEPLGGQYITLRMPVGDPAPVRNYSLSSSPYADAYRISVKREPHGLVSNYVYARLHTGAVLEAAAPRGEFVLIDETNPVLLISAGIGVTPVLAMLHQLATVKSRREVWWIHAARDARQHPFADEARQLVQSLPQANERIFYTSPDAEPAPDDPIIRGRPSLAAFTDLGLSVNATAYVCGPAAFMDAMREVLGELGIAPERIHTEMFGARTAINPGLTDVPQAVPHQPPGPPGTGPQITFARSGLTTHWSDSHRSVLELAEACDVPTRWSCRTGVCHTCVTPLLSGSVGYRPAPLEIPVGDQVLLCCAQPREDVVLDL